MLAEVNDFVNDESMHISIIPQTRLEPVEVIASQNPALVYVASLANGSHRTILGSLDIIADILTSGVCDHQTLPWWLLRFAHTNAVRAWLSQNYAASTGNKMLAALKGTLKRCWLMGLMAVEDYMRAVELKRIKGSKPNAATGRALTHGEFSELLNVCAADITAAGPRDASMLGLGVLGGLRREEITELQLEHYDVDSGVLWVHGKGNKTRTLPVASGIDAALSDWLHYRDHEDGALFYPVNKGGNISSNRTMQPQAVYDMVLKRGRQAGLRHFTPHDMRRTFAGNMLDAGADIAVVQQLMGHASSATTASYDRRGERAKSEAIGRVHMNWTRRHD